MKKLLTAATILLVAISLNAQKRGAAFRAYRDAYDKAQYMQIKAENSQQSSTTTGDVSQQLSDGDNFEGDIVYETYENYSPALLKQPMSPCFNGMHRIRLTIKGNKAHVFDETLGCHYQFNGSEQKIFHYCDYTQRGMSFAKILDMMMPLQPRDISYKMMFTVTVKLAEWIFNPTGDVKNILGHECEEYSGKLVRDSQGQLLTYDLKAYLAKDLPVDPVYKMHVYGWDLPRIALNWQLRYNAGFVPQYGDVNYYIEADVVELVPREVDDSEFAVPVSYKITDTTMSSYKYFSGLNKALKAKGLKGGNANAKTTGVHFKTEGEWDF